ncbi:MAG: enoyl-CoA hydratase/isomerase family protein [Proteobacteria bacterium]|nr:enoyl-CoA hydratase/isomerase family protein [Pseudomonadota bacterium]
MKWDMDSEGLARVDLDIGKVNAFGKVAIEAFDNMLSEVEPLFGEVRAILITSQKVSSKGTPIFSAGADQSERLDWTQDEILQHLMRQRHVVHRLRTSKLFIIVLVSGVALGLGAELCAAADAVWATPAARFGFPEARLGIVPGAGGLIWAHRHCIQPRVAMQYIMSGEQFSAEMARRLGLVDHICQDVDQAIDNIRLWVSELRKTPPHTQVILKQSTASFLPCDNDCVIEQEAYRQTLAEKL